MVRVSDASQPPAQRNRLAQHFSPVPLPDSGKDLQLRRDELAPFVPTLKVLGVTDHAPPMLVTSQGHISYIVPGL